MFKKNIVLKGAVLSICLSVALALIPQNGGVAYASSIEKNTDSTLLCTDGIASPDYTTDSWGEPESGKGNWSYVYYGKYSDNSVKYRVLAPKTTDFNKNANDGTTTMLLDCDNELFTYKINDDIRPVEKYLILTSGFFSSEHYTDIEKASLAYSYRGDVDKRGGNGLNAEQSLDVFGTTRWTDNFPTRGRVFLLSPNEASYAVYGYEFTSGDSGGFYSKNNETRHKDAFTGSDTSKGWWLRSGIISNGKLYNSYVGTDNRLYKKADSADDEKGVSPACNVDRSKILLSTCVSTDGKEKGDKGAAYKLTLLAGEDYLKTSLENATNNGTEISVPYTVSGTGCYSGSVLSILVLDKEYTPGNTNGAEIQYYSKLKTLGESNTGTLSIALSSLPSGVNDSSRAYIIVENRNSNKESDYAGAPIEIKTAVNSVVLNKSSAGILTGKNEQLSATVTGLFSDKDVKWTSSDSSVASVSAYGLVTGVSEGKAVIKAEAGDKNATCLVTVSNSPDQEDGGRVPVTGSNKYASSNDNFAPVADSGKINKMKLDFSNVSKSAVKPSDLKMTVIKGTKFTTEQKLQDVTGASGSGGIKVKVNKKTLIPTISCKSDGSATITMEDGVTYSVTFTVQKPKADKSMKKMSVAAEGSAPVTRTVKDLFCTDIDSGDLKLTKGSHATLSDNSIVIDPTAKDNLKIEYQYINKKYKTSIKIK